MIWNKPHYTLVVISDLKLHLLDLLRHRWWGLVLLGMIHSEPSLKMDTFVRQALVAGEIRDGAKGLWTTSFNNNFKWPFIFHFVMNVRDWLCFPSQPTCPLPIYLLWSDVTHFFIFPLCIPTCTLPLPSICMATLHQGSCRLFLPSCWILIITFKGKHL